MYNNKNNKTLIERNVFFVAYLGIQLNLKIKL